MAFHVEFSRRAENDLLEISKYIQTASIAQAARWFAGLNDAILSLEEMPERGKPLASPRRHRQLLYGSMPHVYRILYRVHASRRIVTISHIRHGARSGDGVS